MKAALDRAVRRSSAAVTIQTVDISGDPDLEERYGVELPVLVVNGRKAAKYRVTDGELARILAGAERRET
jgi:hypothetical protein